MTVEFSELSCHICNRDLRDLDVEFHYSKNHDIKGMDIPKNILLLSLRESNKRIAELSENL